MSQDQSLNVIALISGGKDSFYSILQCLANGHKIVALANLYPPPPPPSSSTDSDLNSYMYQTVGHALIPLYASALDLPLYRQEISGSALNSQKDYRPSFRSKLSWSNRGKRSETDPSSLDQEEAKKHNDQILQILLDNTLTQSRRLEQIDKILAGSDKTSASASANPDSLHDETESLVPLLRRVLAAHPDSNAVCSGAILSTYQRTRIENVARRLNLIPLSYLWQYPSLPTPFPRQSGLLDDMYNVGLDARIVKVASGGLDEELLWGNLLEPVVEAKVKKAVGKFGGSVLGEGGEFETLVLDGPAGVWKGKIEVADNERWVGVGEGGEAWVGFGEGAGKVVSKDGEGKWVAVKEEEAVAWKQRLRKVDLWDEDFRTLLAGSEDGGKVAESMEKEENKADLNASTDQEQPQTQQTSDWHIKHSQSKLIESALKISNMTAANVGDNAAHQMTAINAQLLRILWDNDCTPTDIVFTTFLLRSMADFATINTVYSNIFTDPNPPARVTLACGDCLPNGAKIMASFVVDRGPRQMREGLHVQSRSYWAPANIGPYSQAISVPVQGWSKSNETRVVYVAGQIPLVPARMEILREQHSDSKIAGNEISLFRKQTYLSLQHLWRIGRVMQIECWTSGIAFITGPTDHARHKAILAYQAWKEVHDLNYNTYFKALYSPSDSPDVDVWDLQNGIHQNAPVVEDKEKLAPLPTENGLIGLPPFFAIRVTSLPLDSPIEWQALGIGSEEYGSISTDTRPTYGNHPMHSIWFGQQCIATVGITLPISDKDLRATLKKLQDPVEGTTHWHIHLTIYTTKPSLIADLDAQIVPCEGIWGEGGKELAAAVVKVKDGRWNLG